MSQFRGLIVSIPQLKLVNKFDNEVNKIDNLNTLNSVKFPIMLLLWGTVHLCISVIGA